ncbi:probable polygalacturonase At3g15720 [Trifolium pratense]|uniref:probable polygalacturonase At3g15720 n=1 Tax=Trifolium pratense TaxID=57577 RepID=UPI001E69628D|nr:probable polygalacturonase At3g15720 [Trifolium pratense]
MKVLFSLLLVLFIASPILCAKVGKSNIPNAFNILKYGAKGDGHTDDSNAFLKAWKDACSSTNGTPTLIVPTNKIFMTQPLTFQGPCKSATMNVMIGGNVTAPASRENWKPDGNDHDSWITFNQISGLVVNGGGTLNAQGASWWDKSANDRPTAVRFLGCNNLKHGPMTHLNSPKNHISVTGCDGVLISNVNLIAPETSPNTDGVDISSSTKVFIEHSIISSGDDCVAINSGSKFINITNVKCGPGHGISVGSLGKNGEYATVEEVYVSNIIFTRTTNGARIKTWEGGSGYVRKITYKNITLVDVKNPVIIDQQYNALQAVGKGVKISDVTFRDFRGTTKDKMAIQLNCCSIGCTNIVLEEINISGLNGEKPSSSCNNAHGSSSSCNPTVTCLGN